MLLVGTCICKTNFENVLFAIFKHLSVIEKNSFHIFCFVCFSIIFSTFFESFERFFLLFSLFFSHLQTTSRFSSDHIQIFARYSYFSQSSGRFPRSFGRHVTPTDAVCPTRAFAFSSRVSEHSIVPVRTISSGRAEPLVLSFYQAVDPPAAIPLLANATDIPRSIRPTRIGNQFRKTVINGRQRTVRALGVRGPNRAAFEWSLPANRRKKCCALSISDLRVLSVFLRDIIEIKIRVREIIMCRRIEDCSENSFSSISSKI